MAQQQGALPVAEAAIGTLRGKCLGHAEAHPSCGACVARAARSVPGCGRALTHALSHRGLAQGMPAASALVFTHSIMVPVGAPTAHRVLGVQ